MPSERIQRRIDAFLDEADAAASAGEWDEVGRTEDLDRRRSGLVTFDRKYKVRTDLEGRDDQDRTRLFNEMSGFGTHTTVATVSLRIAPGAGANSQNRGFMSVGQSEATQLTGLWALNVATYILSELQESFADYLDAVPALDDLCTELLTEYAAAEPTYPRELNLYR